jgi:hypothetical protein
MRGGDWACFQYATAMLAMESTCLNALDRFTHNAVRG